MLLDNSLIGIFWIIWILVWAISAFNVKETAKMSGSWRKWWLVRVAIFVFVIIVLGHWIPQNLIIYQSPAWLGALGVLLCAAGLAIAIWARFYLGRNWSGVPSLKKDHELITSGPYRFVRHPIYTGIILALLGSSFVLSSIFYYFFFTALVVVFIWRIPVEERLMTETFPNQYPEYKKRTKMLIPFLL